MQAKLRRDGPEDAILCAPSYKVLFQPPHISGLKIVEISKIKNPPDSANIYRAPNGTDTLEDQKVKNAFNV